MPFWIQSEIQSHGRGQRGRKWQSESGNLYITGCFDSTNIVPGQLSIALGVLLANIIKTKLRETKVDSTVGLKWPNDLLIDGKKCGGILIEMSERLYIGIGINFKSCPGDDFDLNMPATHLPTINREWLVMEIINSIDKQFLQIQNFDAIQKQWWSFAKDCIAQWCLREPIDGEIIGIDAQGQLLIKNGAGKVTARHQTFA